MRRITIYVQTDNVEPVVNESAEIAEAMLKLTKLMEHCEFEVGEYVARNSTGAVRINAGIAEQ